MLAANEQAGPPGAGPCWSPLRYPAASITPPKAANDRSGFVVLVGRGDAHACLVALLGRVDHVVEGQRRWHFADLHSPEFSHRATPMAVAPKEFRPPGTPRYAWASTWPRRSARDEQQEDRLAMTAATADDVVWRRGFWSVLSGKAGALGM